MQDIDDMDMIGYLKLRVWKACYEDNKTKKANEPKHRYIDEAIPWLKP